MCPKYFVENRNISNILEEAPPLRNKWEFGEPTCLGVAPKGAKTEGERKLEPARATES